MRLHDLIKGWDKLRIKFYNRIFYCQQIIDIMMLSMGIAVPCISVIVNVSRPVGGVGLFNSPATHRLKYSSSHPNTVELRYTRCILSFGWFPGIWFLHANILEHFVCSIFMGGVNRKNIQDEIVRVFTWEKV